MWIMDNYLVVESFEVADGGLVLMLQDIVEHSC